MKPTDERTRTRSWLYCVLRASAVVVPTALLACCVIADEGSDISGTVHTRDGTPLSGAWVRLEANASRGSSRRFVVDSAVTDEAGCFDVFGLHPPKSAEVTLSISAVGYKGITLEPPVGPPLRAHVVLEPTQSPDSSVATLAKRTPDTIGTECTPPARHP